MDYASEKKQKPLSVIILTCIVLLIVMMIGIYMIKGTTTPPQKTAMIKSCLYDAPICSFLAKLKSPNEFYNGPITATISVSDAKNQKGEVMLQADTKNNVYITSTQSGKPQTELLTIGALLYKKDANGVWKKQTNIDNNEIAQFRQKAVQQVNKSGENITYTAMGEEPCGNLVCLKYAVSQPSQIAKDIIYFDTKDYVLRKFVSEEPNGNTTVTTFAYTPLTITPPPIQ